MIPYLELQGLILFVVCTSDLSAVFNGFMNDRDQVPMKFNEAREQVFAQVSNGGCSWAEARRNATGTAEPKS